MDAPNHIGRPQQVAVDGKTYTLGRWRRRQWSEFIDWARPFIPNPRTVCEEQLKVIPQEQGDLRAKLVKDACIAAVRYLQIGSPEMLELLGTLDGSIHLVAILLKEHHGDLSEELRLDAAYDIAAELGERELQATLTLTSGTPPPKENAPGAGATMNAPSTTPGPMPLA